MMPLPSSHPFPLHVVAHFHNNSSITNKSSANAIFKRDGSYTKQATGLPAADNSYCKSLKQLFTVKSFLRS